MGSLRGLVMFVSAVTIVGVIQAITPKLLGSLLDYIESLYHLSLLVDEASLATGKTDNSEAALKITGLQNKKKSKRSHTL